MTLIRRDSVSRAAKIKYRFWAEGPTESKLFTHMVPCSMFSEDTAGIPDAVAAQTYQIVQLLGQKQAADRAINFSGWIGLRELNALPVDVDPSDMTDGQFIATRVALMDLWRVLRDNDILPRFVYADPESDHSNPAKAAMLNYCLEGWTARRAAWYLFDGLPITDGHRTHTACVLSEPWFCSNTHYFDTYALPRHAPDRPSAWCWLIDAANTAAQIIRSCGFLNYCPVIATPHTHAEKFQNPLDTEDPNGGMNPVLQATYTLPEMQAIAREWWQAMTAILVELGTKNFVIFNHTGMNGQRPRGSTPEQKAANEALHNADDARASAWLSALIDQADTPATIAAPIPYTVDRFTVGRWTFQFTGSGLEIIGRRQ